LGSRGPARRRRQRSYLHAEHRSSVALAACDTYRPAAVEQLVAVGTNAGAAVYEQGTERTPLEIATWALERARKEGKDVLIIDTSGRLHVDAALMDELVELHAATSPTDVLLVLDAMTGQDAVNVAEQFSAALPLDGTVMTKLDGDARGGAALSVRAVSGKPILFASTGEKLDQFERFHPERMAQRILGMGDVLTLIEKAGKEFDERENEQLEKRIRAGEFDLDDFLGQLRMMRRMGPLQGLLSMIPGVGSQLKGMKVDEREIDRIEAIILSMTAEERRRPDLIKGSRRLRIARGSGTNVQAVNQLVKQFAQVRKVMRQVGRGKMPDLGALARQQH
jgi:signal recognition particle subunit SRP54